MDYHTLLQQLHKGEVHEIYFFYGEESLLQQRAMKALEQHLLPAGLEDFNKDVISGADVTPKQIAEMAMNLPFMAERRLLVVQPPLSFLSIPKSDKNGQASLQYLLDYLEQPNPQCCLIFCGEGALAKTGAINKKLQECAAQVEFAPLKGKVLEKWIADYVDAAGRKIDRQALDYLSAINSFDLQIMEQELQKLLLYKEEEPVITLQHVQDIVTKTVEANIFALSDSIGGKKGNEALHILKDMFYLGESPFKLIGFLVRHFRNLLLVKDYRSQGYDENQIKEKTKLHPFVIKKSLRQAERFTIHQLITALERLLQIEVELKSTTSNGEELLEQFVIELCYM
ncbi:MAG: DNA polymerase III subunit delta [Peptococcaceae bacterium]|nr:DNA polymerase III subunit delta [Peptococcaceae bacterium]